MKNETLVYHLGGCVGGANKRPHIQCTSGSTWCLRFKFTHLDNHLKGEHSGEDVVEIAQDLQNTRSTVKISFSLKKLAL